MAEWYEHPQYVELEEAVFRHADDSWDEDTSSMDLLVQFVDHLAEQVMRSGGCLLRWCHWTDREPCDHGYLLQARPRPPKCPRCDSRAPELHPAMQHEGEVQVCPHPWHDAAGRPFDAASQPWRGTPAEVKP